MKNGCINRFFLSALGVFIFLSPLAAEGGISFSGAVSTTLNGLFSENDFHSVLNPGNAAGLGDLMAVHEVVLKLEAAAYDEGTGGGDGFRLWTSFSNYPVGSALLGLASSTAALTDSEGTVLADPLLVVSELNSALGESLLVLDLMRLSYTWSPGDFSFTLGRHSFLTGYGYGWNPMDLVSPLKDPSDPKADLRGSDGLSLTWDSGSGPTIKLFGLYDPSGTGKASFEDLKGGGEVSFFLPALEFRTSFLWGKDEAETTMTPNGVSTGFLVDIFGAGLYAEASLRQYARLDTPAEAGVDSFILNSGEEWVFSALGGFEYYLPTGTALILEYFYNGEGFDQEEMQIYKDALTIYGAGGGIPTAFASLYREGYFARHYGLVNIFHSFWDPFQIDLNLTGLGSFDTGALSFLGMVTIYPTASLSIAAGYGGFFELDEDKISEAGFSPVNHTVSLELGYSF